MRKRVDKKTEESDYLTDKDLLSETEIDEDGHTLYCKWGKKRRFKIDDPPPLYPFGRPRYRNILIVYIYILKNN